MWMADGVVLLPHVPWAAALPLEGPIGNGWTAGFPALSRRVCSGDVMRASIGASIGASINARRACAEGQLMGRDEKPSYTYLRVHFL